MKSQFKIIAIAAGLAFASVSSFATDIAADTILLGTQLVSDIDTAIAVHDTNANDLTFTNSNAVIFQAGDGNVAVIDQTGANFALIAQAGTTPATALIVQTGTTSVATIVQR